MRPHSFVDLAQLVLSTPRRLGRTRLVAVDGPSSSGKTLFAERLGREIALAGETAYLEHVDDLAVGWDELVAEWSVVETRLFEPLRRGETAVYPVYEWPDGRFGDKWHNIPPGGTLIFEGIGSARRSLSQDVSFSVFVQAPRELRFARGLERDGEELREAWLEWLDTEDDYFTSDGTAERVDLVVDGAPELEHDQEQEYVTVKVAPAWADQH